MKILEQSSTRLVIRVKNSLLAIIPALIFSSIGILITFGFIVWILFSPEHEILNCQRVEPTQVDCKLNQWSLMGLIKRKEVILQQVQEAKVRTETNSEGEEQPIITIVATNNNIVLSNDDYSQATQINSFLHNSQEITLEIEYDAKIKNLYRSLLYLLYGFPALSIGLFSLWAVLIDKVYTFDKITNTLFEKSKFLSKTFFTEYSIQEITDVILYQKTNGERITIHYVVLIINRGESLKGIILTSFSTFWNENENEIQTLSNTIAQFLNLSLTTKSEDLEVSAIAKLTTKVEFLRLSAIACL